MLISLFEYIIPNRTRFRYCKDTHCMSKSSSCKPPILRQSTKKAILNKEYGSDLCEVFFVSSNDGFQPYAPIPIEYLLSHGSLFYQGQVHKYEVLILKVLERQQQSALLFRHICRAILHLLSAMQDAFWSDFFFSRSGCYCWGGGTFFINACRILIVLIRIYNRF